jgi:predicted unusual protein kinase regulating ubiquinone biosynthesis (AarF/ABC1/UbiB family)
LVEVLAKARGLPMKIGQILASLSGEKAFSPLVDGVEPRPLAELLPGLRVGNDGALDVVLAGLEESSAAASLGQVHRSCLADGTIVAVKIQYPGMARAVRAELGMTGMVPVAGPVKSFSVDTVGYQAVLADNMERELDYRSEAERQLRFRSAVQVDGLVVPEAFPAFGSERILVQTWQDGVRLPEAAQWPLRDRLLIARILLETFLTSLFVVGEVHGDPNPGNYLFKRDDGQPRVVLLDYGCTVEVSKERRLALLGLIFALRAGQAVDSLAYLAAVGFEPTKLVRIADGLPALCRILFEPFLLEGPFRSEAWRLGQRLESLLEERRWWFRSAGPVDGLLLVRAFQGVVEQLKTLDVALPWWPLLQRLLPSLVAQQAEDFRPPPLPNHLASRSPGCHPLARKLEVLILEDGEEIRRLSLPAEALLELPALLPEKAKAMLVAAGVDVEAAARQISRAGFPPQEVFRVQDDSRSYRAWLE